MSRALSLCIIALLLAGCSAGSGGLQPMPDLPAAGAQPGARVLRNASGAPIGIRVHWDAVPGVLGYRLYRSDASIPDSARGDDSFWVTSTLILHQEGPPELSYDDLFDVELGQEWFYRVSAVNSAGVESALSAGASLTIGTFSVFRLVTLTAPVGDAIEIEGEHFGQYDPGDGDGVRIPAVVWSGVANGFAPIEYGAQVLSWEHDRIRVLVPSGATRGQLVVAVGGEEQLTPEEFENSDPYIIQIAPRTTSAAGQVVVTGANFGDAPGINHALVLNDADLDPARYVSYGDEQIVFNPPYLGEFGQFQLWVRDRATPSNIGAIVLQNAPPLAELSAMPTEVLVGEQVSFDASASSDPEGLPLTFVWDFDGDGTNDADTGNTPTVQHNYPNSGNFNARVTVTDAHGTSRNDTVLISVSAPNNPPAAVLDAEPTSGTEPLTVEFDATASSDPDSDQLTFEWDFDNDGTIDEDTGTDGTTSHTYGFGEHVARVVVTDEHGLWDEETIDISVQQQVTIDVADDGSDPAGAYYKPDQTLYVGYQLSGGTGPYDIDWYLHDGNDHSNDVLIASDSGLSGGFNEHTFDINGDSPFAFDDSNAVPLGKWQIYAEVDDSAGGAGDFIWPREGASGQPGFYDVYRYDVGVVIDAQGDGDGTESEVLEGMLISQHFSVSLHSSTNLSLQDIAQHHVLVWAAGAPTEGNSPYEWLGSSDTQLIRGFVDTSRTVILFGPPSNTSDALFPQDEEFNDVYQPFAHVSMAQSGQETLDALDFTADDIYTVDDFSLVAGSDFGHDNGNQLLGGVAQSEFMNAGGRFSNSMAVRAGPEGGRLYFGLLPFSQIESLSPNGTEPSELLTNIINGSVSYPGTF